MSATAHLATPTNTPCQPQAALTAANKGAVEAKAKADAEEAAIVAAAAEKRKAAVAAEKEKEKEKEKEEEEANKIAAEAAAVEAAKVDQTVASAADDGGGDGAAGDDEEATAPSQATLATPAAPAKVVEMPADVKEKKEEATLEFKGGHFGDACEPVATLIPWQNPST